MLKIYPATGEGQGRCRLCALRGKWVVNWMCFMYKVEGLGGVYCNDCVKELKMEEKLKCSKLLQALK